MKKLSKILPKQDENTIEDIDMSSVHNDTIANAMVQCGLPPNNDMPLIYTTVGVESTASEQVEQEDVDAYEIAVTKSNTNEETIPESNLLVPSTSNNLSQQQKSTRKSKQQREAEATLQLLEPEDKEAEALRKQYEALEIFMNAKEVLNPEQHGQFCKIVQDLSLSTKEKFAELHNLCSGKMELQELLLDLLSPQEALQVGVQIYQQFCVRDATKRFLRKVKKLYVNQPTMHSKLLKDMQSVLSNPDVKIADITNLGQKYFKTNQHLLDEFMSFASGVPYPEGLLPEAELICLR